MSWEKYREYRQTGLTSAFDLKPFIRTSGLICVLADERRTLPEKPLVDTGRQPRVCRFAFSLMVVVNANLIYLYVNVNVKLVGLLSSDMLSTQAFISYLMPLLLQPTETRCNETTNSIWHSTVLFG
jgi:hypothetical protein